MPEIGLNIISKGALRLDAYFEQYRLTLLEEETKEIVSVGEKVGNLYFLPIKVIKREIERVFLITKKDISLDYLQYLRLSYINKKAIRKLYSNTIGHGYTSENEPEKTVPVNNTSSNTPIGSLPLEKEFAYTDLRFEVFTPDLREPRVTLENREKEASKTLQIKGRTRPTSKEEDRDRKRRKFNPKPQKEILPNTRLEPPPTYTALPTTTIQPNTAIESSRKEGGSIEVCEDCIKANLRNTVNRVS